MGIIDGLFRPNVGRMEKRGDVRGLVRALRHGDPEVRQAAAMALGSLRAPEAADALLAALADPEGEVRARAAAALGYMGEARAAEPLAALLADGDESARAWAAISLGKLGDRRAVGPLMAVLGNGTLLEVRRREAAALLGKLGDGAALEALVAGLGDAGYGLCGAAAEALGELGDGRAAAPLAASLARLEQEYQGKYAERERRGTREASRLLAAAENLEAGDGLSRAFAALVRYTAVYVEQKLHAEAMEKIKAALRRLAGEGGGRTTEKAEGG